MVWIKVKADSSARDKILRTYYRVKKAAHARLFYTNNGWTYLVTVWRLLTAREPTSPSNPGIIIQIAAGSGTAVTT